MLSGLLMEKPPLPVLVCPCTYLLLFLWEPFWGRVGWAGSAEGYQGLQTAHLIFHPVPLPKASCKPLEIQIQDEQPLVE